MSKSTYFRLAGIAWADSCSPEQLDYLVTTRIEYPWTQRIVANILWWDLHARRKQFRRGWKKYKAKWVDCFPVFTSTEYDRMALVNGLVIIGFSREEAMKRAMNVEYKEHYIRRKTTWEFTKGARAIQ